MDQPKDQRDPIEVTQDMMQSTPDDGTQGAEVQLPPPPPEPPALFSLARKWLLLASFLLPFLICVIVYLAAQYYPVGDKQILVTDFWHQYYPMICELREKLLSGGSLLYTWHSGLGTNFLSMMSYYCASPLNLLTVFMPEDFLRLGVTLIVFAKIGLCGLTGAIFLHTLSGRRDVSIVFFSTLWALCAYIMGYYWNLMWLDSVALMPLVMLGAVLLIRDRKPLLYTVSLALCLFSNYYIGLYVCIILVPVAISITIICWESFVSALRSFVRMLVHSLIGIGATAILLLPAYLALRNSYYVINPNSGKTLWNANAAWFLSALYPYQHPNTKDLVTPNLCCGILCLVLFFLFLFGNHKKREKICACLILFFLFFSFLFRPLDFIWNGMHFVNMIPFRYSFLFSFLLVALAYRAFCSLEKTVPWKIMAASIIVGFGALALYRYLGVTVALVSFATTEIYMIALIMYNRRVVSARIFTAFLCLCMCAEAACAGVFGIHEYSTYSTYLADVQDVRTLLEGQKDTALVRTEVTSHRTLNDSLLYGYNGVTQFSSSANSRISQIMKELGLGGYPEANRYAMVQTTAFANAMLGIKYYISRDECFAGDPTLREVAKQGEAVMLEIMYALPVAFAVYGGTDTDLSSSSPFRNQSDLFSAMTGLDGNLYQEYSDISVDALKGTVSGDAGTYTYHPDPDSTEVSLRFRIDCSSAGIYYLYPRMPETGSCSINCSDGPEDMYFSYAAESNQPCIFSLGYHEAGETIWIFCSGDKIKRETTGYMSYAVLDQEYFERGYARLCEGAMTEGGYTDTSVKGKVNVSQDATLFTSIPYEAGWRAYVDGREVEVEAYHNAFVSLPLSAGEHTVELRYLPDGFPLGALITLLSFLACGGSYLLYRRKRANGTPSDESDDSAEPTDQANEPDVTDTPDTEGEAPNPEQTDQPSQDVTD